MTIAKITTHLTDAIGRMLYQFRGFPGIEGLVGMHGQQAQDAENAGFDFISKLPLQTATGAILDRWGAVLDEARNGATDADYRALLFFKISKNIASGTPEELISILQQLMQGDAVELVEDFPAALHMTIINPTNPADPALIFSQMQQMCPAGVQLNYLAAGYSDHPFAFLGNPNPQALGFSSAPGVDDGGQFVSIL
jgi:hypothetical protein